MSEKNILIELPDPPESVLIPIERRAHHEVAELHEELKSKPLNEVNKILKDKLYREKCDHQSALYFKDKRIEELTKIIQDKSAPKK